MGKRITFLFIILFGFSAQVKSQMGSDSSAILNIESIDKGILVPRMTTVQRESILNPAHGLMVYDVDTQSFWYNSSKGWKNFRFDTNKIIDADGDTKVEVEKFNDEDRIRFTTTGEEIMSLSKNSFGVAQLKLGSTINSIIIGKAAGINTVGSGNTFLGYASGRFTSTGAHNSFFGGNSGYSNTTGTRNTYFGVKAGYSSQISKDNVAFGFEAARHTLADYNASIGSLASWHNVNGAKNISIGFQSLFANDDGDGNIAIEHKALGNIVSGPTTFSQEENTVVGYMAGIDDTGDFNTTIGSKSSSGLGNYNIAIGHKADLYSIGDNNIAIGRDANGPGMSNIYLGHEAGKLQISPVPNYSVALGYKAKIREDNTIILGNYQNANLMVGIGVISPLAKLHVNHDMESGYIFKATAYSQPGLTVHFNKGVSIGSDDFPDDLGLRVKGQARFSDDILIDGVVNIGGGSNYGNYELSVDGEIACEEVRIQASNQWPDYVFEDQYRMLSLDELQLFIDKNGHLPGLKSASEMEGELYQLGEMQERLLEKIEELFLYVLELKNENKDLKKLLMELK